MKKQFGLIAILLGSMLLAACESTAVRHEEAFTSNPEWSEHNKKLIAEGIVEVGMTKEQVRAAWGSPCSTCTGTKKFKSGVESWEFHTQVVFFGTDGKVSRLVRR